MPHTVQQIQTWVMSVKGLCVKIAHKYASADNPHHDDLISAAYLGALKAAHRFEPERGLKFTTIAHRCIECSVIDELRKLTKGGVVEQPEETPDPMQPEKLLKPDAVLQEIGLPRFYLRAGIGRKKQREAGKGLGFGPETTKRILQCGLKKARKLAEDSTDPRHQDLVGAA
jgi:RNA polymerase sigma factor (sigma-70 family)